MDPIPLLAVDSELAARETGVMHTQALIQQLLRAGDHPHPDLLAAILACEEAAVEPLIAIISDPEMYWDRRRGQPRWLPEIAMGLLGDLRSVSPSL